MNQHKKHSEVTKDRHPPITLGLLTTSIQIGFALIQRMDRHSVIQKVRVCITL